MVKILHLRWLKDPAHEEEQNAYDKTLSGKEKLIESLPQVLVKVGMLACAYMPNNNEVKADFQILLGNYQQLDNLVGREVPDQGEAAHQEECLQREEDRGRTGEYNQRF